MQSTIAALRTTIGQGIGSAAKRNLAFVQGLEQSGLRARGCAVNFVQEYHVCEERSQPRAERQIARIEDLRTQDVCRQEIRRALDSLKRAGHCLRERPACQRLGQTRSSLEQHVSVRD